MKKTLVILAAGIGSRFGDGIKQLEPVDNNNHIIIDYSIHDAIEAGFNKIVIIIRHDIERDFKLIIGNRIESVCKQIGIKIEYAFQDIEDIPIEIHQDRQKPWGTGHAVLSCSGLLDSSFSVINADDYYGKSSFIIAADFLNTNQYGMVAYKLRNTLSENGGVTRGICEIDNNKLIGIKETKDIVKNESGAESNGKNIDINSLVSMNFWCYPIEFIDVLKKGFPEFLKTAREPLKDEYLLPIIADEMIKGGTAYKVLSTNDKWFGVTYQEDKNLVKKTVEKMISDGLYKEDLYSDLYI